MNATALKEWAEEKLEALGTKMQATVRPAEKKSLEAQVNLIVELLEDFNVEEHAKVENGISE